MTQKWLENMQHAIDDRQVLCVVILRVLLLQLGGGTEQAVKQLGWKTLIDVVDLGVESVGPKHKPVLFADFLDAL